MASTQELSNQLLSVYQRGVVECEKCRTPIVIHKPNAVSVEFSVPCNKCGHRAMYFKRMIYTEDAYERRKTPRK